MGASAKEAGPGEVAPAGLRVSLRIAASEPLPGTEHRTPWTSPRAVSSRGCLLRGGLEFRSSGFSGSDRNSSLVPTVPPTLP